MPIRTRDAAPMAAPAIALALVALVASPAVTAAQTSSEKTTSDRAWPDKPVKMIVPFAAGGGTDFIARLVAKHLSSRLGQSVFVENRGGANGIVGLQAIKQAPPDGYTIATASDGPLVMNHGLYKDKLPYDSRKDFAHISLMIKFTGMIVVHPSVPARNIKELIAYAKANPGKLDYSTAGIGNFSHMGVELFMAATGTRMVHVPFTGVGPGTQALIAGDVKLMFNNVATVLQAIEAKQLVGLGVGEPQRLKALPDLPAIAEDVPGYEMAAWTGVIGPAGLPRSIVDRLAKEVHASLADPEMVGIMDKQQIVPQPLGPDAFGKYIADQIVKWNKVIDDAGIKIAQ